LFIGGLLHETNTYVNGLTGLDSFEQRRGGEVPAYYRNTRTFPGGVLEGTGEIGADAVCGLVASAEPSGVIAASAYDAMKEELLSGVAEAGPLDGVVLCLHGAAISEGLDDLEADLCGAVRAQVGPQVPIVVTLDLHGNISQAMADTVNAMFGDEDYPHIDMYERGLEAVRLLSRLWSGSLCPVTHVERLPMLLPTTTTFHGVMAEINRGLREMERRDRVVDVTLFHGFPLTDVPGVGMFVTVTTDDDRALARAIAVEAAELVWSCRDQLLPESLSAEQAIERALSVDGRPVVINETSDNCGGGAPGDGTHLLGAMLAAGLQDACFGFIVDPAVAEQAHRAGPGATIQVRLGGKTDRLHGDAIEADAYVKCATDGRFRLTTPMGGGSMEDLGRMALLQIRGVDVIVGSKRAQTFDAELFLLHGIDVRRSRVVALKSSQHFRAGFEPLAAAIVTADTPGLTTLRLEVLQRVRTQRPIWPLDSEVSYVPSTGDRASPSI
jgi:microcystin degradation protein MlrC